jgi:hypothetical protein
MTWTLMNKNNKINLMKILNNNNYTFNIDKFTPVECSLKVENFFNEFGFCVFENVIPQNRILQVKEEILVADKKIRDNLELYKKELKAGKSDEELLNDKNLELRESKYKNRPPKPANDIIWLKEYSNYLANEHIVEFAKKILDDHLKISQLHIKNIASQDNLSKSNIKLDDFGLPRIINGNEKTREWHTDWPHDPWAYGAGNENENIGSLRLPYPDFTFGLVMLWFLTDTDENNGGTFIVPKSHKFKDNPRVSTNISVVSPIEDEMQIKAKAGSVFVQDTRLWHSSSINLNKNQKRVAVLNRWYPWWLSVDDYAPQSRFNVVCRPLSKNDYKNLPEKLKPMMSHLCPNVKDLIQKPLIERSSKAAKSKIKQYQEL